MPVLPDSLKVNRCYLTSNGQVVRLMAFLSDNQVHCATRMGSATGQAMWRGAVTHLEALALSLEREVPCDRTPEKDEI